MTKLSIDINETRNHGNNIIKLSSDYNNLINELLSKLENVSVDNVWNGQSALSFVEQVKKDKVSFLELGNQLKKYGQVLTIISDKLEEVKKVTSGE